MATAGDLCTTIIGDLQRGDASLSDIVLIDIKSSIREYENTRFFFNEALLTATLSATDTYALSLFGPSGGVVDVVEVDNFDVIINSTRKYPVEEKTMKEYIFLASSASGVIGYPQFFAVFNQAIKIYPMANSNYTAELWGHVKFAEIQSSAFATSNVWTNEASELIRYSALKRLWGVRFKDPIQAQAAREGETIALAALKRKTDALAGATVAGYL